MNIKDAKEEVKNTVRVYLDKDTQGNYMIPVVKQRPIFLMGPPGIGKTAIMEQVAQELGIGILSYSMTHHTRQSALGLPYIVHKNYGGRDYEISEYTMSEIIAAVYDTMENSGVKEGILFLDEINCVSETLAPAMLQFLQFKIFGRHRVPDGWIVVTAGNPPEYNNSVREFDIVTWDRLKRIDVDPDYEAWKEYAINTRVHPAITSYLEVKKNNFYVVETTVDGKSFATARGWDDLSVMIRRYENHDLPVKETLIRQYIQHNRIAKDFSVYYDLFRKYKQHYQIGRIMAGNAPREIINRAQSARFDERLALIGLLLEDSIYRISGIIHKENTLRHLVGTKSEPGPLKNMKTNVRMKKASIQSEILEAVDGLEKKIAAGKAAGNLTTEALYELQGAIRFLEDEKGRIREQDAETPEAGFAVIEQDYNAMLKQMRKEADEVKTALNNMFSFEENAWSKASLEDGGKPASSQEILITVTELTLNKDAASFISRYGCEKYFDHNSQLLLYERNRELMEEIKKLDLEKL